MPEEVGSRAAKQLFEEVSRGGAVDSTHQVHCMHMMAPTPDRRASALHLPGWTSSHAALCDGDAVKARAAALTEALAVCTHYRA